ncbi:MAG: hypothetical protein LBC98_09865 [Prevotellaceae bacterium]|jgi:hypothetical protein|nr:hypothetical protein [Prevotellaceae bacterium]
MATINQHFNLTLPSADAAFFKTLAKKMGWTIEKAQVMEENEHSPLYYQLQGAFRDVKLMMDGEKPKKTIEEFLAELPDDNNEL